MLTEIGIAIAWFKFSWDIKLFEKGKIQISKARAMIVTTVFPQLGAMDFSLITVSF